MKIYLYTLQFFFFSIFVTLTECFYLRKMRKNKNNTKKIKINDYLFEVTRKEKISFLICGS